MNKETNRIVKIAATVTIVLFVIIMFFSAWGNVPPGHVGAEVSWGGKTNMDRVIPEGANFGIHWVWDNVIPYDVREHTLISKLSFNDKNDMITNVVVALDYKLKDNDVNKLHSKINDYKIKISSSLSSAAKEVVPQYSAVDLNKNSRALAEKKLAIILKRELPEFYVEFKRVRFTDIDLPEGISRVAEQTAIQIGKNELASKMEAEKISLSKAKVAEAQGNYDAGILNAKTKDIMSSPKMLEMMRIENERVMWEGFKAHGKSPFGTNNWFGAKPDVMKMIK